MAIRGGEIGCFHNQTVREEAFVHGQRGCPQVQSLPALRVRLLVPPAPTAAMGSRLRAATAAEGADPDFGAVTGPPPRRKQRREPSPLTAPPAPGSVAEPPLSRLDSAGQGVRPAGAAAGDAASRPPAPGRREDTIRPARVGGDEAPAACCLFDKGFSGLRPWPTAAAHVYMPPFLYSVREPSHARLLSHSPLATRTQSHTRTSLLRCGRRLRCPDEGQVRDSPAYGWIGWA